MFALRLGVAIGLAAAAVAATPQGRPALTLSRDGVAAAVRGAMAGTIQGRVTVVETTAPPGRPAVAELGDHHRRDAVDRRRAVVYLDGAIRRAFEDLPAGQARMDQRGEQFVPRVLAITVGTTVQFPNSDTTFHNVFSLSRVRTFDLGRYPPRRTGSVKFDRTGIVPVFCDIHSHMSAYILVFSHPFFAVTETDGHYAIANVPAGGYTLRVWSELGQAEPRRVVVGERETVEADFHVGRGGA
jgi:plastocyanin